MWSTPFYVLVYLDSSPVISEIYHHKGGEFRRMWQHYVTWGSAGSYILIAENSFIHSAPTPLVPFIDVHSSEAHVLSEFVFTWTLAQRNKV